MSSAKCPDCGRHIDLRADLRLHEVVICPHCDADLEVVSKNPPELDWAYAADFGEGDDEEDEEDERERDEEKECG